MSLAACNNDIFIDTFDAPAETSFTIPGSGGEHSFMLPTDNMTMAMYVESGDYNVSTVTPDGAGHTNFNWLEGDGKFIVTHPRVDMTVSRAGRRVDVTVNRYYSLRDETVHLTFSTEYQSFTDTLKIPAYNPFILRSVDYLFESVSMREGMGTSSTIFEGTVSTHGATPMKFPFILSKTGIPVFYECLPEGSGEMFFDMVKGSEIPIPSSLTDDPEMWRWGLLGDKATLCSDGVALLSHYPPLPAIDEIAPHTSAGIKLIAENESMQFTTRLDIYNAHLDESHRVYMWLVMDYPFDYTVLRNDTPIE